MQIVFAIFIVLFIVLYFCGMSGSVVVINMALSTGIEQTIDDLDDDKLLWAKVWLWPLYLVWLGYRHIKGEFDWKDTEDGHDIFGLSE